MKKLMLISSLLLTILLTGTANAKVTNQDLYKFDDKLTVSDTVDGTVFYGGDSFNSTKGSEINGMAFFFGNNASVNGSSEYLFLAGNNISFNGTVLNDAFIAGNVIEIGADAKLKRDVYIAGDTVTINSNVERNLKIGADTVTINGIINGDVYLAADTINIENNTTINGTLTYNEDAKIKILRK